MQAARGGGGGGWCGLPELPFFRRPFPGADAEIFPHGDILLECSSFEAADARRALPVPQLPLSTAPLPPFRPQCLPTATDRRSPSRTTVPLPTTNDFPIQKTPVIPRGSIKRKSCPHAGDVFAPSSGESGLQKCMNLPGAMLRLASRDPPSPLFVVGLLHLLRGAVATSRPPRKTLHRKNTALLKRTSRGLNGALPRDAATLGANVFPSS